MKAATTDELAEGLQVLFASLQTSNPGEAMELRMRGYLLALRNISAEAFKEVVTAILEGTAGLEHPHFVPTPPELARLCREREQRRERFIESLIREEQRLIGAPAFSPLSEPPPLAVQQRIEKGFQALSKALEPVIEETRLKYPARNDRRSAA